MAHEESPETPHSIWNRQVSRRKVLAGVAAAGATAAFGAVGVRRLFIGGAEPEVLGEGEPVADRYALLGSNINKSSLSPEVKSQYLAQVEKYRTIESVQTRFMGAYLGKTGPDGITPELLYYTSKLWPTFETVKPEDQIFFLRNENLLAGIRNDLDVLAADFDASSAQEVFDTHNRIMSRMEPGNVPYAGINVPLESYLALGNLTKPPEEELTYAGFLDAEILKLGKIKETLGPIYGKYKISRAKSYVGGDNTSETSLFDAQTDARTTGEIRVVPEVAGNAEHEFAHATNPAQNRWIALHLTPEELVEAATAQAKALADPVYGVQYGDLGFLAEDYTNAWRGISQWPMTVLIANDSGAGGGEIYPKGEISDFAKNRLSGGNISQEEFWKLVDLPADANARVRNWQEFTRRHKGTLDKLAEVSDYFAWVVNFIREDTARADRLNSWNLGKDSPLFGANSWDMGYFNAINEHFDGVFMICLFSGDDGARKVFDGLQADEKRIFLAGAVRIYERVMHEQWAYGTSQAMVSGDNKSPFLGFYREFVPKYT